MKTVIKKEIQDYIDAYTDGLSFPEDYYTIIKRLSDMKYHLYDLGLQKIKPEDDDFGVCYELSKFGFMSQDCVSDYLFKYSKNWAYFSGDGGFPVPSGDSSVGARERFDQGSLWSGDYGMLRRSYCKYIGDCLSDEIRTIKLKFNIEFGKEG